MTLHIKMAKIKNKVNMVMLSIEGFIDPLKRPTSAFNRLS